jgi:nucleoside diphosphate kinase
MSFIKKMVGAQVAKMVHETNTATSQMRQTVGEVRQKKCGISSIKKWDFERKTFRKKCGKTMVL